MRRVRATGPGCDPALRGPTLSNPISSTAAMLPPPEGLWGMPPERLKTLPGYDPDLQKNRTEARQIMQRLGYGRDNPLAVKVAARNIPLYRDPAVMLIDQLKEIYIAGELEIVETAN